MEKYKLDNKLLLPQRGKMKLNWISIVGVLLTIALATMFGLLSKSTEMGLIIVAGAIGLAFLNIDKIQRFKGAGFEAEMKKAVENAIATIEQLRNVATTSARATLTSLMAANFMSGTTMKNRLELHDQLISNLVDIGASKQQIEEADEMWKKGVGVIYHRGIKKILEVRNSSNGLNIEASQEFQNLLKFDEWKAPSSVEIKKFIESKGLMEQELKDLIDDYRHYESTGIIKRKELFFKL